MTEKAKLNKESLEKHFPKVEIPRLHYDCDLSMLEYKSPIQVRVEQAVKAFNLQVENEVYKAVRNYEINVDKDELLKALRYDRNQYDLGYRAGYRKASEVAREIFEEIEKSLCVHTFTTKTKEYADGASDTIEWVDSKISEIKKKYTEEQNNV